MTYPKIVSEFETTVSGLGLGYLIPRHSIANGGQLEHVEQLRIGAKGASKAYKHMFINNNLIAGVSNPPTMHNLRLTVHRIS